MPIFDRLFGEPMSIVTGDIALGAIGDVRLQLALNHVCSQLTGRYGRIIAKLQPSVSLDNGTCYITAVTVKGVKKEKAQEIYDFAQNLLTTEVACQRLLTDLLEVVDRFRVEELVSSGKENLRAVGSKINDQLGFTGMEYLAQCIGRLRSSPGLVRTIEVAWNGIGNWQS